MNALGLMVPPELVNAIAEAVADELERRGTLNPAGGATMPYLTVDEAAEYLRAKPQRIYDLVHAGEILPARDGRRLLFRRETLDAYLCSHEPPETVENVLDMPGRRAAA